VQLRIPATLGISKCPAFRGLRVAAGILMDLDVNGIDRLEWAPVALAGQSSEKLMEASAMGRSQVETLDAVPLAIFPRNLVPDATGCGARSQRAVVDGFRRRPVETGMGSGF
jgi:hypothetical protein